ncbi:hypothetical protein LX16_4937 [Stackebrandtia albiflava]|uniref:Uncharacterized protein n=1 Tax=Stackebrandtia albiflava TaxID=406432 RepID=A0A562UQA0_9ACTN|nr:hypothetical protein [Stackebrandtia albiflava]TWJ07774.1 hypothetical protein LX16_4937 [Stackebrandtia albiflava]
MTDVRAGWMADVGFQELVARARPFHVRDDIEGMMQAVRGAGGGMFDSVKVLMVLRECGHGEAHRLMLDSDVWSDRREAHMRFNEEFFDMLAYIAEHPELLDEVDDFRMIPTGREKRSRSSRMRSEGVTVRPKPEVEAGTPTDHDAGWSMPRMPSRATELALMRGGMTTTRVT